MLTVLVSAGMGVSFGLWWASRIIDNMIIETPKPAIDADYVIEDIQDKDPVNTEQST